MEYMNCFMDKGILEPLYGQDGYATSAFFGIIYGPDLFAKTEEGYRKITGEELKDLILLRLKMAYDDAINKVEECYTTNTISK